ncbi:beta-lactamase inhibitor (BLIP) [Streptomyces sp. 846.5]|nr:hypothetical protein [Streptomyces sp. 846.5]TDT98296.1 beta-lactamase inhibitor (BLIP) [Streptomyces sp. 846.5]
MKKIFKAAMTVAAAGGLMLGTSASAHADGVITGENYSLFTQSTASGFAEGEAWWTDSSGTSVYAKTSTTYASGFFANVGTGYTLNAWLERSTDGGATWHTVSGVHSLNSGGNVQTYPYYDGPGYLARACFQFTSWSGAAVHCSAGI